MKKLVPKMFTIYEALNDEQRAEIASWGKHTTAVQPHHIDTALKDKDIDIRQIARERQKEFALKETVENIINKNYSTAKTLIESSIISIFEAKLNEKRRILSSKF